MDFLHFEKRQLMRLIMNLFHQAFALVSKEVEKLFPVEEAYLACSFRTKGCEVGTGKDEVFFCPSVILSEIVNCRIT